MKKQYKNLKRAQVWYIDLIIALFIFVIIGGFLFIQIRNMDFKSRYDELQDQAISISNNLLSSGYPKNWTSSNVVLIGLCDDYHFNITKYNELKSLDYNETRRILGTYYFYYFNISGTNIEYGYISNPKEQVVLDRFVYYNKSIRKMTFVLWRE